MSRDGKTIRTSCGSMPCMAPELALCVPYIPQLTDSWSTGVVMLETGGGVSSFARSVGFDLQQEDARNVAPRIKEFFQRPGSHRQSLKIVGGVESAAINERLEALLVPDPSRRA